MGMPRRPDGWPKHYWWKGYRLVTYTTLDGTRCWEGHREEELAERGNDAVYASRTALRAAIDATYATP